MDDNADLPVQCEENACTKDTPDFGDTLRFCNATHESYHVDANSENSREQALGVSYMVPTPKCKEPKDKSLTPIMIAVVGTIGTIDSKTLLKVLLDPGSTKTLINRKILPKDITPARLSKTTRVKTLAGTMTTSEMVILRNVRLPEFDKNQKIEEIKALTFDQNCRYDVILGADFLTKAGINIMYKTGTMEWFENVIPMHPT